MIRSVLLVLLFSSAASSTISAQSPTDGRIEGGAYVNSYFHVAYAWPKILQPYDTTALRFAQHAPNSYEFLLFSAREGAQPHGVVMIAEKLNVPTPHTSGIKDARDFLSKVEKFRPEQHAVIQSKKHFTNGDGLVFDELDYTDNGIPSSAMVTQAGQFLIVFKCDAGSATDLALMTNSVAAMRRSK
ncbi:MAG TPA: hypothetical protein VG893_15815 [Terracidiphilus sp.]|nr:hypothetical protein [Terracidiphilus sp.]